MYLLQHGVNLSRRACRALLVVLLLLAVPVLGKPRVTENNAKVNEAGDPLKSPKPDLQPFPDDYRRNYDGVQFGPLGPVNRDGLSAGDPAATTKGGPATDSSASSSSTEEPTKKPIERYKVASVSFSRVEVPFIIGLWIFCASLAKIGKSRSFSTSKSIHTTPIHGIYRNIRNNQTFRNFCVTVL